MAVDEHGVVIISDSPSPVTSSPPLVAAELGGPDFDLEPFTSSPADKSAPMAPALRADAGPGSQRHDQRSTCEEAVLNCFPDICPEYLKAEAAKHSWDSFRVITSILDEQEKGRPYPKRSNARKRKRSDEDEEAEQDKTRLKYETGPSPFVGKGRDYARLYIAATKIMLKEAFPHRYSKDVDQLLAANDNRLYATYLALDQAEWDKDAAPARVKKSFPKPSRSHGGQGMRFGNRPAEMDAMAEFDAASAVCEARARARSLKESEERAEAENLERAKLEGTIAECGCCYDEFPLNRMVHCDGKVLHWFCRGCMRRMAENVIGLSKYHLNCPSTDGCDASFAKDQTDLFLDAHLSAALDAIEKEAVLRMAGIENLETCPFCPYAAEYPPVEENKEFRCEEALKERGHSARRAIEEAMSAALIRKCNKCGTPFIKENGCNKMVCTRNGCNNVQCYVCSQSCDYTHFNDPSRGGKPGNCPLFDNVEERHEKEVRAAEEQARKAAAEQNPDIDAELLKINFSERVKQDDERRKAADPARLRQGQPLLRRSNQRRSNQRQCSQRQYDQRQYNKRQQWQQWQQRQPHAPASPLRSIIAAGCSTLSRVRKHSHITKRNLGTKHSRIRIFRRNTPIMRS
ncbi:a2e277b0-81af-4a53-a16e-2c799d662269 [Thermothielavioides terrestris]|uniref:A2e277b0-81af-4a53-a16e-2c799d662269 n=1 Tax=Thermothielavioides terrestris TaxID=2587410 RepID=A0A3S4D895_9PEZI|nr:a2e277b0-81af-4a53-a16e-2c799d662269 [Thermothielavioides terrestris]